ncbi:AsnC family transcriptional regulator [Hahella sp. KA22]|uniref:AsnC family transcriptional regulator n=1 Tax=Hahella sp. KA22 TaxID=1628392 RepID=UPI000FDD9803|nr:AsnC family transcriptional regulator [Hahella sp. KA22]AZZ93291.1 Lrp/AsnC family transcriptional regulator [Hahella sp. KA22]QAY56666.1 AsnC family transcriptional regulator [Hahella sp. KA22]
MTAQPINPPIMRRTPHDPSDYQLDSVDRRLINRLQTGFPICDEPYAAVASELDISEADLLKRLRHLLQTGYLTRFGPFYHAERLGGGLTLAAMQVAPEHVERVSTTINRHPEVAHNYERDHALNLWFVVATEKPEDVEAVLAAIALESGYPVHNLPKQREFYVGLHFQA